MGAHDDAKHTWLAPTKDLVRDAVARRTPTLGICLGHQLVAAALGGRSGRNPLGSQLGLLAVGWTDEAGHDPLTHDVVGTGYGVQWNDDVVLEMPPGTVVLARTPAGELQAARFAPTVWGVQLHPEVDEQVLAAWAGRTDRDRDDEGVVDAVAGPASAAAPAPSSPAGWRPLEDPWRVLGHDPPPRLIPWASRKTSFSAHSRSETSASCGCGSPTCWAT